MDTLQHQQSIRHRIRQMESAYQNRSNTSVSLLAIITRQTGQVHGEQLSTGDVHLPRQSQILPWPEYVMVPGLLHDDDNAEIEFYVACSQGWVDDVTAFLQRHRPSHAVRQYGLEQASFENQPNVASHLLQSGTLLHSNVFERLDFGPDQQPSGASTIFDRFSRQGDLVALMQKFIDAGWHPNQAWHKPDTGAPNFPLCSPACVGNRPLVSFLLARGEDPNLGASLGKSGRGGAISIDHQSQQTMSIAIKTWDVSLVRQLVAAGAKVSDANVLRSVIVYCGASSISPSNPPVPFSQRRAMAEYLRSLDGVHLNSVFKVPLTTLAIAHPADQMVETTVLSSACAAQDWEFVEWLLALGADPYMLDSLALKKQWWLEPYLGPNNPDIVRQLVDNLRT